MQVYISQLWLYNLQFWLFSKNCETWNCEEKKEKEKKNTNAELREKSQNCDIKSSNYPFFLKTQASAISSSAKKVSHRFNCMINMVEMMQNTWKRVKGGEAKIHILFTVSDSQVTRGLRSRILLYLYGMLEVEEMMRMWNRKWVQVSLMIDDLKLCDAPQCSSHKTDWGPLGNIKHLHLIRKYGIHEQTNEILLSF